MMPKRVSELAHLDIAPVTMIVPAARREVAEAALQNMWVDGQRISGSVFNVPLSQGNSPIVTHYGAEVRLSFRSRQELVPVLRAAVAQATAAKRSFRQDIAERRMKINRSQSNRIERHG